MGCAMVLFAAMQTAVLNTYCGNECECELKIKLRSRPLGNPRPTLFHVDSTERLYFIINDRAVLHFKGPLANLMGTISLAIQITPASVIVSAPLLLSCDVPFVNVSNPTSHDAFFPPMRWVTKHYIHLLLLRLPRLHFRTRCVPISQRVANLYLKL